MSDENAAETPAEKTEKQVTLYHPTLTGVSVTVDAAVVDSWTASGWRKTRPKKG